MHQAPHAPPPSPPTDAQPIALRLSSPVYDRTWELELLISGAVVFALLQLPDSVARWHDATVVHLARASEMVVFYGYMYVTAALYVLIGAFVTHLAARAYWVGLVGLQSVFPGGTRWERVSYGPLTQGVYRERVPALPSLAARVDRFCSTLFSFAFLIVFGFAYSILGGALVGGLAWGTSRLLLGGEHFDTVLHVLLVLLVAPITVAGLVDKAFGERLEGSRAGRALRRVVEVNYNVFLYGVYTPISLVLFSNVPKRAIYPAFALSIALPLLLLLVGMLARVGALAGDGYRFLPDGGDHGVDYAHYESQRPADEIHPREPTIQSDMIREPFVRLFVPYVPDRHNELIETHCPGVEPLHADGVRLVSANAPRPDPATVDAAVACMARLQPVSLNGRPVAELRPRLYRHPRHGLRGLVAYLPTAALPAGENVLEVAGLPLTRRQRERGRPEPAPHRIPFWMAR